MVLHMVVFINLWLIQSYHSRLLQCHCDRSQYKLNKTKDKDKIDWVTKPDRITNKYYHLHKSGGGGGGTLTINSLKMINSLEIIALNF